jgi:hypothetical protein
LQLQQLWQLEGLLAHNNLSRNVLAPVVQLQHMLHNTCSRKKQSTRHGLVAQQ